MFIKKLAVILIGLVAINGLVKCQMYKGSGIYTKGVIITKNDTINCFIEYSPDNNYSRKIRYKQEKSSKKTLKISSELIEHIQVSVSKYDRVNVRKFIHYGAVCWTIDRIIYCFIN